MKKRFWAILLAGVTVVSMAACGKDAEKSPGTEQTKDGFAMAGNKASVSLGVPDVALDPQTVYSEITYTPEMFYGKYSIREVDGAVEKFATDARYATWSLDGEDVELSTLPTGFEAGDNTFNHRVQDNQEYDWMRVNFQRKSRGSYYLYTVICAYSVDGNRLLLTPVDDIQADEENDIINYHLADFSWEYTFDFKGRTLTISQDGQSVDLLTGLDAYRKADYFYFDGYLSEGSAGIDQIEVIHGYYNAEDGTTSLYFEDTRDHHYDNCVGILYENGLFTFTTEIDDDVKTYQYVYFYCGDDGIVLTDGKEIYYYNDSFRDHIENQVSKYVADDQDKLLEDLSETQLEEIAEKTENLLEDLAAAYVDAGLNVTVNAKTGEIALDSTILFDVNEYEIEPEGQEFLRKFIQIYTSVVFSDKYDNFVSTIMVEGHTDTNGSYDMNLTLSQNRAESVKNYCLSEDCDVDQAYAASLKDMLQAVGYSYDQPIYDDNGGVDMDASRRVSFRFIINLEQ